MRHPAIVQRQIQSPIKFPIQELRSGVELQTVPGIAGLAAGCALRDALRSVMPRPHGGARNRFFGGPRATGSDRGHQKGQLRVLGSPKPLRAPH
jgi:hypothetical protein